tara:strand:- start:1926 stop:2837 length:912 start_codon:yes stop_codon:yes gene_type:complete
MDKMDNKKLLKVAYHCKCCEYKTYNLTNYKKHLGTNKHQNTIDNLDNKLDNKKLQNVVSEYKCKCGKKYNYLSGLCKHKNKCDYNKNVNNKNEESKEDYKELVMKLITDNQEFKREMFKENQELRNQIKEMIPLIGNNNNSHNTNNLKQKFNINVFLNEKCKDAISIDQFIDTIEVSIKNLLTTKDKGLGEGLSSIIIDNMNKLSLYERPMHCTDKKRETMYIKNHEWAKDEKLEQVDKLLKCVENKQLKNIEKWTDANPDFMESEKLQEEYMKLIKGCTTSIDDCKAKTIKNICDKVYLEKE